MTVHCNEQSKACDIRNLFWWNSMCLLFVGGNGLGLWRGWGLGSFLRWRSHSTMWAGPLISVPPRGCQNNPIFSNLGLCTACCAHFFMCHHELWPTSASLPFSSLSSSLGITEEIYYQKINIAVIRLVLQTFALQDCLPFILFYHYLFSVISPGWVVITVYDYFSPGN